MIKNADSLPIVYHPGYSFGWSMHGYDRHKSRNVKRYLEVKGLLTAGQLHKPYAVTEEQLRSVHPSFYLDSLKDKSELSRIFQMEVMKRWFMPQCLSERAFVTPIKYHTGGTIAAGQLAMDRGWAINLGGGAHHASRLRGEGFCPVADLTISIHELRKTRPEARKIMIIDLDAHQGNGHERDFFYDSDVYTIDVYTYEGEDFYPNDEFAMNKADIDVKLAPFTDDATYLGLLEAAFSQATTSVQPDIIYYIAGSDILAKDVIGRQSITPNGLIARDEIVFDYAIGNNIPIVMLFGGGYQKNNAAVIADSIENLDTTYGLLNINRSPS